MIVVICLQFHDYQPKFATVDLDSLGDTKFETDVKEQIENNQDDIFRLTLDGNNYEDEFGVFSTNMEDVNLPLPQKIDKIVYLTVYFE